MIAAMKGSASAPGADLARIAWFAAAYFALTSLAILWSRFGGGLALIWPGTALLCALLTTLPRRRWPAVLGVFAGLSAAATALFGLGPQVAVPLALVNVFEGWVIALLLLALRPRRDWLESVEGLTALVVVAGVAGPALAAGAGGAIVAGQLGGFWLDHALDWLPSHGLGTLLTFPLACMAARGDLSGEADGSSTGRPLEFLAHGLGVAAVAGLAFFGSRYPLLFLPIAPLLLAALRLGRRGASLGMIVIAAAAAAAVHSDSGFFARLGLPLGETALFVQFYLATLLLLALPASVALRQHQLLVAELEDRKALERLVADHSEDALLNLDETGLVRYASPAGQRLSGQDELVGKPLGLFFDPLDQGLVRGALAEAAARPGETRSLERPVLRGDEQVWLEAKLRAVAHVPAHGGRPEALHGYAVTIRDVTARKHAELDAIQAAETDPLTGLANRRAFHGQLERALAHAGQRPFALAILDLDHFKSINDTHGHMMGDAVLREVAAVMRRLSNPSRFFARIGGEEFALIGRQRDFADAERLCERLRAETAALRFTAPDGTRFSPTASIGLTPIAARMSAARALQAADTLLYAAKNSGRDRIETPSSLPARTSFRRVA